MAKGNKIHVAGFAKERKIEGIIGDTSKPGTIMQIKGSTAEVAGRLTYIAYAPAVGDGAPRLLFILDVDMQQGKTVDDAYVSGTRGCLLPIIPADEYNVRKADISGTSSATEDLVVGQRLLVVDGTGKISPVAVGVIASPVAYPFVALEALTDQPAETLVYCQATGY